MSIQNGASTTTKLNGGIAMKNVLKGFKVFNTNGEVVSYENPNNFVTELDIVRVTINRNGKVRNLYSLPSPVFRSFHEVTDDGIKKVRLPFISKLVCELELEAAKSKANEEYEALKQQRHKEKPLSKAALSKKLYEPQNMLEFIKQEEILSTEIITIDLTERVLIVTGRRDGQKYPLSHSINYETYILLSEEDLKAQYDMVFFTDHAVADARVLGQPVDRSFKIVHDHGYGVAFKDINIRNRHLLYTHGDDETLLKFLDSVRSGNLVKKQHTVYHVEIKDIESDDQGVYHYKGNPIINEYAASSHLLEVLEDNGYTQVVLNTDFGDRWSDQSDIEFNAIAFRNIYKNGFWMEINGEPKLCRRILQTNSQARSAKISFSDCPLEDFWKVRGEICCGTIKEGDNIEPNKAEKRFGHSSSTSIKASKVYQTVVIDDLQVETEQKGHELVYDEEKSLRLNKPVFRAKTFKERRTNTPSDGQIFISHVIAARLSLDLKLISDAEFKYWIEKTCTSVPIQTSNPNEFPFKIVDCKAIYEIKEMIKTDSELDRILKLIITGAQIRLKAVVDKGLAIMLDYKKYWQKLENGIINRCQKLGKEVPEIVFDPELIVVMDSAHKIQIEDVFYDSEVRICNYTYPMNKKPEKHELSTQAFFSLELPQEVIKELADRELKLIARALENLEDAIKLTGNYGRTQIDSILNKMLTLDKEVAKLAFKHEYIQKKLYDFIEKRLLELQYGKLLVKAETHYITCDPLAIFEPEKALKGRIVKEEVINGKKVTRIVQHSEIFFADQNGTRFNKEANDLAVMLRHPNLNRTENALVKLVDREELWYLRNIVVVNAYDNTFILMSGADVDGDKVLLIFEVSIVKRAGRYHTFIKQGLATSEKRKAGLIKDGVVYHYDYKAITEAHITGTEKTEIAEATNTILRMTELFSAQDVSSMTDKDLQTFHKEIYASIVQLCCMSGQLIDQAGIPESERLYMKDYAADYWGKYPFISKSMVEYRMHKKGIHFNDIDPKHFETFEKCKVVDLDTPFRYMIQYVRNFMAKLTTRYVTTVQGKDFEEVKVKNSNNAPLSQYIANRLPKNTETNRQALKEIEEIAHYWAAAANTLSQLPNEKEEEKEILNEAWDQLKTEVRELILSVHPDPRVCAALTYFHCYGSGYLQRETRSKGLVWVCMLEEFIEFLTPGYSCMYLKAPAGATKEDEVVVVDGALFLRRNVVKGEQVERRDFFVKRVGYKLTTNELVEIGGDLHMIASRPRSTMFIEPSTLIAMRIRENADNRLLKVNTNYQLSFQQGKLFVFTMENALVGQAYTAKARFKDLDGKIIRVDRLACGSWQFKGNKTPTTITSSVLISIVGESENPYVKLRETFTQEAIVSGIKGYAIKDEAEDVMVDMPSDVISAYEEIEVEELADIDILDDELLVIDDNVDSYVELEQECQHERALERAEATQLVKARFTPKSTPVVEVENDFDVYDEMDEWFL